MLRGKRIEWVVNFHHDKNYQLFSIEEQEFQHTDVFGGKKTKMKAPFSFDRRSPIAISLLATATELVHRANYGKRSQVLEDWKAPEGRQGGKFGFHIPNRDKLGLSEFTFRPAK